MTAVIAWGAAALAASAGLIALVLVVRGPVRRALGPAAAYALWALPAARLVLPPLALAGPMSGPATAFRLVGPRGAAGAWHGVMPSLGAIVPLVWLVGAVGVFALFVARHVVTCRRLRAAATLARIGAVRVVAGDVAGPVAFGVVRPVIAVPRTFARDYGPAERDLALAHEAAHHVRGDLLANWVSLAVLAAHWWNPLAWVALAKFRDDQEFATDAHVLAGRGPAARATYAHILAKAAGIGALPAASFTRANLKERLMMLTVTRRSPRQRLAGGVALALFGGVALAATATAAPGRQAVTIGVKPDGAGGFALVIGDAVVAPGAPLPGGATLPGDFDPAGGCDLKPAAKPVAMVIKGTGPTTTYTVMCAGAAPAPVRATLAEGLASLTTMRASVATQPASAVFPEAERAHALGAIDRSIREVRTTLGAR